jgi:hypothetical protein
MWRAHHYHERRWWWGRLVVEPVVKEVDGGGGRWWWRLVAEEADGGGGWQWWALKKVRIPMQSEEPIQRKKYQLSWLIHCHINPTRLALSLVNIG